MVMRVPGRLRSWLGIAVVLLIAFNFALNLQQSGKAYVHADAYTHYVEKRPYQYRVLMAPVMGGLMHLFASDRLQPVLRRVPVYVSTPEGATYVAINAVTFAASCFLMLAIGRRVLPRYPLLVGAVYLVMAYLFICLNPNIPFILPYDMPALALSQACILCILDRRWRWLVPLFALATLNRETSFLVIGFMAARALLNHPQERTWGVIALLCAVWIVIKLALFFMFSHLPSDEGLRIGYNLRSLAKPWQWPALLPLLGSVAWAARSLWTAPAEREWAVVGCVGFLLVFAVGQVTETRAFADLMVYFSIAIAGSIAVDLRSDQKPA